MPAPRDRKPRPPWKFTPLRVTETKGRGHLARGSRFGTGGEGVTNTHAMYEYYCS